MTADDTVTAKLAEWEALVEGATEGPWEHFSHPDYPEIGSILRGDSTAFYLECEPSDAEFIATAREMVPALLGFVREVLAECDRLGARNYVGESGSPSDYMSVGERVVIDRVRNLARKWIGGDA